MEIQNYKEWSLGVHRRLGGTRVPAGGTVELTRRCNLRCAHCYNNLPVGDLEAGRDELTCEEHCRIVDEISEAGCLWLLFTGGEPLVRKDFLDIYSYAKAKGLLVTLFTNGTLLTPHIADQLAGLRPFCIEITLYGHTRDTYERITGVPGSYDRCMQGIQLLLERGLPLKLKTMGISLNKHEIWDMKRFGEEGLHLEFRFDSFLNPRFDGSSCPLNLRLSPAEVVEFDLGDPERMTEWKCFAEKFNGPVHRSENMDELYHCGGGINSFAVDPYGILRLCTLSLAEGYALRSGSFREGWEKFIFGVRRKKITRHTKCTACGIKAMCGMCPANGELEKGDPEEPLDFLCQVAHLRAYALDIPVPPHGDCEYCPGGTRYEEMMEIVGRLRLRSPSLPLPQAKSSSTSGLS